MPKEGNRRLMEKNIREAQKYADKVGMDISNKINNILIDMKNNKLN